MAKILLTPPALVAYVFGTLTWCAVDSWNNSIWPTAMCLLCPKETVKAAVFSDSMWGTRYGSLGIYHIARQRRDMKPAPGCVEEFNMNLMEILAFSGKCWCCTCPKHAQQVHGHCSEAPCQVCLLDSDPSAAPPDVGEEFCGCG